MVNKEGMNIARVVHYGLFSAVFKFLENEKSFEDIKHTVSLLCENSIDNNYEEAFRNMNKFLNDGGFNALQEENNEVFYSPTSTFIPVTASYYDEQRDDGKKHLKMIDYVLKSKFRRDTSTCKEHEDHIEFILHFIQKLIEEEIRGDKDASILSREVFENVLNPMIDEFSENLYLHEKSDFYKNTAVAMRVFISLEREILNVDKPISKKINEDDKKPLTKEKKPAEERVKKNMEEINSFVE